MLFVFDWDGTLSDSTAKIVRCMQLAAGDAGLDVLPEEGIRNIIGLGLPEAISTLYPLADEVQREKLRAGYSSHFLREDTLPSPFFPGVLDALDSLRRDGFLLTVATGKSRRGLDRVLENLDLKGFFHGSRCADETASKPHPQMLNELLLEFSVDVKEAVMIGDTEYDMAMAREIDMHRIAVSYGAHHIERLLPYEPGMCIDSFNEILKWRF